MPSNVDDRLRGVYENLKDVAESVGSQLDADSLAKLNACVTELQSLAGATADSPSHAPMTPPEPTVANPPSKPPPTPPKAA